MSSDVLDIEWRAMHDAVVESIVIGWDERAWVHVNLLPNAAFFSPIRPIVLVGSGLTFFECPQHNPWGPSDIVNGVEEQPLEGGSTRIEIEMQSGDVIVLEAASFVVKEGGGAPRGNRGAA